MRFARPLVALVFMMEPVAAVAAPIQIRLIGEIDAVYSSPWLGLNLPPSIVAGAPVNIALTFEPTVLRLPENFQRNDDSVFMFESLGHTSAEAIFVELLNSAIELGSETIHWTNAKLWVSDNEVGGVCSGFSCSTWTSDTIKLLGWGEATAIGDGVRFTTSGGLSSQQHAFGFPPSNVLVPGSDLANLATWNGFPDSSFYIKFESESGNRRAHVTVHLSEAVGVPEPASLMLAIVVLLTPIVRRTRRSSHN